ncbi:4'-phosphopantetheinyl transferase family protein [Cellulomonas shaoxiangyii]|uniref:4'-phosphopantetheinyl transferase superfamily protein n=1 Tax=Cellulomonas shaoxiangyii TaxID=2566013 RepID=A0A4P7SL78_9CELL|nr:4'-phosphopantetheinyl transferase superfamily protein [Cellulomonas shaoxiangyii]QCB94972.1 4'-phosphopantetheinyl transferase superfamily protein [Cellulomonas shaoxiangyii]TGY79101.1 4'-phosphopantetheinyl transferase superfamily protein [Cellulomonas shaoxiangyii]
MTHDATPPPVVHVLRTPHQDVGAAGLALLSPGERARADAYRRDDDRRRSRTAALLLRCATAALTGTPPAAVPVHRRCATCGDGDHGRPGLPGTGWHASVSHAGAWCVVALTRSGPVGVDVEVLVPLDVAEVAPGVLGPGEVAAGAAALLRLWTRKEAVVKATGQGLRTPLGEVLVGPADAPAVLLACPGVPPGTGVLRDVDAPPGHLAAVCVLTAARPPGARPSRLVVRGAAVAAPADAAHVLPGPAGAPTGAAPSPPDGGGRSPRHA